MDERVAFCKVIAHAVAVDGKVNEDEHAFLAHAMQRLKLTGAERTDVVSLSDIDGAETVAAGLPLEKRRELLDQVVAAVLVDRKLSAEEMALVERLSALLGFAEPA